MKRKGGRGVRIEREGVCAGKGRMCVQGEEGDVCKKGE